MSAAAEPAPAVAGALLHPASLEAEFRQRSLAEDARTAGVLVAGFTLLHLPFLRSDLVFLGWSGPLAWLAAVRLAHLAFGLFAALRMRRSSSAVEVDRLTLAWALATSALDVVVASTRPPSHYLPVAIGVLMVAGNWTLLPNRFRLQGLAALSAAAAEVAVLVFLREPLPAVSVTLVAGALALALLGGGWVSWRLHGARRRAFLELKRAEAARDELARALAEIRTLRGLVPICASCKAMRGPDGRWHELEVVLSRQTEAEFTHGICDRCIDKLYPER